MVAADDEIAGYVRELERRADQAEAADQLGDLPSGDTLAAQLEQFLPRSGRPGVSASASPVGRVPLSSSG